MERAELLALCSEEPGRITRRYGTPALASASGLVAGWMRGAGMAVRRDAIGNVIGRCHGGEQGAPELLLGSHIDTVRDAGRYDGVLGVLVAIAVVERLRAAGRRPPVPLEVVAFADEEGTRFGTAFLGSSVLAGRFDPADLSRVDADGVSLEEAIREFRGDPAGIAEAARAPGSPAAYAEVHAPSGSMSAPNTRQRRLRQGREPFSDPEARRDCLPVPRRLQRGVSRGRARQLGRGHGG
jgi:allantoate deiminase